MVIIFYLFILIKYHFTFRISIFRLSFNIILFLKNLETGAWSGIALGVIIAFPVLVVATMNIIIGILATILILCVTSSILGVIYLVGWKIDVSLLSYTK